MKIIDVFLNSDTCDLCGHPIKSGTSYCERCKKIVDKFFKYAKGGRISKLKKSSKMTLEPLKNKKWNNGLDGWFTFNDVKSAIDFYKKYKYHLDLLKQEQPEAFKEWCNSSEYTYFKKEMKNKNPLIAEEYYRDWLFDYSFQDVV